MTQLNEIRDREPPQLTAVFLTPTDSDLFKTRRFLISHSAISSRSLLFALSHPTFLLPLSSLLDTVVFMLSSFYSLGVSPDDSFEV